MSVLDSSRKTKIVCTLGPSSSDPDTLRALVRAGMDVARFNFSHGTHEDHSQTLAQLRQISSEERRNVAVLQDLCGPKIRVRGLPDGQIELKEGASVRFSGEPSDDPEVLYVTLPSLAQDVHAGQRILLDDGHLEVVVVAVEGAVVVGHVVTGGPLKEGKGCNLPETRLSVPSLTDKDKADAAWGIRNQVDYMALSFVRSADDVRQLRQLQKASDVSIPIVAKLERPEAIDNLTAILAEADVVMVARGDLGVELPLHLVPVLQKQIITEAVRLDRPVITATQMLQSMMENPRPTRAEASDVANAIFDGSDAVMLSGETAAGRYPVETVKTMDRIARETESYRVHPNWTAPHSDFCQGDLNADAVCLGAYDVARKRGARLLVVYTAEGKTALLLSRYFPEIPIIAITFTERSARKMALYNSVIPLILDWQPTIEDLAMVAERRLLALGWVQSGDLVVSVCSSYLGKTRKIDMVRLQQIP